MKDIEKVELKNCPFCGSPAELHTRYYSWDRYTQRKSDIPKTALLISKIEYPNERPQYRYKELTYIPRCTSTGCVGRNSKQFFDLQEAIAKWNMRV